MDNMNTELGTKTMPTTKVKEDTNTSFTTGLILEVSVAITISSEVKIKPILLNKVFIDTGCTRTIIKRNSLPDQFFESQKQLNNIAWTTNDGKFVT